MSVVEEAGIGEHGRMWKYDIFVEMERLCLWRHRENNGKVNVIRQRQRLDFESSLKFSFILQPRESRCRVSEAVSAWLIVQGVLI